MKDSLIAQIELNSAPSSEAVDVFVKSIGFPLDPEYLAFIQKHDGGEGYLSNDDYISLWSITQVVEMNPYYDDESFCETVIIFGSNGSDTAYGMTKADHKYFHAPYIGMADEITYVADSFRKFLDKLSE